LSPAQIRQKEADSHPEVSPPKNQTPQSFTLSEGDFPSLGTPSKVTPKPAASSWGAKRPAGPSTNGVNGRAIHVPVSRGTTIPGSKNLASQVVTELVRFHKHQLQNPNAKDFVGVCDRIAKHSGVEKIGVSKMKVSEVVTFSIIGKPENVVKARNRLQNEVGIKVICFFMELIRRGPKSYLHRLLCFLISLGRKALV
jgi:hypothetical protein